jgi:acyl-CoA reductase-like NAD-dependent aldehyde dehydrogenase
MTNEKINDSVKKAKEAFSEWKKTYIRSEFLYAFANEFRKIQGNSYKTATQKKWKGNQRIKV